MYQRGLGEHIASEPQDVEARLVRPRLGFDDEAAVWRAPPSTFHDKDEHFNFGKSKLAE
jgi:hypothetical protein